MLDKKLNVDPKNIYSSKDEISFLTILTNITEDLWREGRVEAFITGINLLGAIQLSPPHDASFASWPLGTWNHETTQPVFSKDDQQDGSADV